MRPSPYAPTQRQPTHKIYSSEKAAEEKALQAAAVARAVEKAVQAARQAQVPDRQDHQRPTQADQRVAVQE